MPFQFFLRLGSGILAAFLLHLVLDGFGLLQQPAAILLSAGATTSWSDWLIQQVKTLAEMYVIICAVMLLQRFLDVFHISDWMGRLLGPALRLLGVSPKAVSIVVIGFTMGLLYGSGIRIKNAQQGTLSRQDALCAISLLGPFPLPHRRHAAAHPRGRQPVGPARLPPRVHAGGRSAHQRNTRSSVGTDHEVSHEDTVDQCR